VGELVTLIEAQVGRGPDPALVAVGGIESSGKSTLAALLASRMAGTAIVHQDEIAPGTDRAQLVSTVRTVLGWCDAAPRVLIVEGRHLFPSAVAALFDVRVWMDVAPDGGEPSDDEDLDAASGRPDDADVLFVPVSGMVPPIRVRFMPEAGCDFVLWDDENDHLGELEDLLPMPAGLREELKAWADRHYRFDGGSLRLSRREFEELRSDGDDLVRRLQAALGRDYTVVAYGL
jgi:hypothetical protein